MKDATQGTVGAALPHGAGLCGAETQGESEVRELQAPPPHLSFVRKRFRGSPGGDGD